MVQKLPKCKKKHNCKLVLARGWGPSGRSATNGIPILVSKVICDNPAPQPPPLLFTGKIILFHHPPKCPTVVATGLFGPAAFIVRAPKLKFSQT